MRRPQGNARSGAWSQASFRRPSGVVLQGEEAVTRRSKAPESGSFRRSEIDPDALRVVRQLRRKGFEAYLVGGCVRDLYLSRRPKDFDVATDATPPEIRKVFRNSRIIGRRFTIVHVYYGSKIIETATFRQPPKASEGDDNLIKQDNEWGSLEDDAQRRDFTINGLFYDVESDEIVDAVDGIADLDRGVIRCIGVPKLRFEEDPVRMLRAIKFAARLDFVINQEEWEAIHETASDISRCSRARVLEEIYKLLRSGSSHRSFALLQACGLLDCLWPDYISLFSGLGELSRQAGEHNKGAASRRFWEYLSALDGLVFEAKQVPANGVLLALIFSPLIPESLFDEGSGTFAEAISDLMKAPCVALGVARRDRELAQDILESYRRIRNHPPSTRRRRSVVQRRCFNDTLVYLGLIMASHPGQESELRAWQELAASRGSNAAPNSRSRGRNSNSERHRPRRSRRGGKHRRARG